MTLTRNSATFLLAEMAAGRLSAADLMAATLERIAAANPRVNAIVALHATELQEQVADMAEVALEVLQHLPLPIDHAYFQSELVCEVANG